MRRLQSIRAAVACRALVLLFAVRVATAPILKIHLWNVMMRQSHITGSIDHVERDTVDFRSKRALLFFLNIRVILVCISVSSPICAYVER